MKKKDKLLKEKTAILTKILHNSPSFENPIAN